MNTLANILAAGHGTTATGQAITRALNLLGNPDTGNITTDVDATYASLNDLLADLAALVAAINDPGFLAEHTTYNDAGPTFTSLARDAEATADTARWRHAVSH
jgi:hypothetical protein